MNNDRQNSGQEEESQIEFSLQLELAASILGIIADALSVWALLEAIEETKADAKEDAKERNSLDGQLQRMQTQIDQLTEELAVLKSNR